MLYNWKSRYPGANQTLPRIGCELSTKELFENVSNSRGTIKYITLAVLAAACIHREILELLIGLNYIYL